MPQSPTKVLLAAYECAPFYKVGGLGDVAGSLPKALKKLGVDIRVVLPYYPAIKKKFPQLKKIKTIKLSVAGASTTLNIFSSSLPGSRVPIYFLGHRYFNATDIFDADNRFRFVFFSYLVSRLGDYLAWSPEIIHLNDWHTGLVPIFLKKNNQLLKTIFTIHNLAYSGDTELSILSRFGLTAQDFSLVKNGSVNLMREAIIASDLVTTVSPTYAQEILTPEFGCGLDAILRSRKKDLFGIINGLDYEVFNPATDKNISARYSLQTLERKKLNKIFLQQTSGLPIDATLPVLALISRLAGQKGFDLLAQNFDALSVLPLQLIILGSGEKLYEKTLTAFAQAHPEHCRFFPVFDPVLANQIYAGADLFLMPSRYEPCGLGQLIAMRYGTLPLVRATGGLRDTVRPYRAPAVKQPTGFAFQPYTPEALLTSLKQALAIFNQPKIWRKLQENAMKSDFSWPRSAREYSRLYRLLA